MEQIDLSEIQELLDDILGGTVDFQQLVEQGTPGKVSFPGVGILHNFGTIFLQELSCRRRLWVHVLLLAVASAVLLHFAEVFKNRSVSQISFAMIYMILLLILMVSFQSSMEIARDVLLAMRNFMTVLAPAVFSCNDDDLLCGFGRGVLRIYSVVGVRPSAGPGIVCAAVY